MKDLLDGLRIARDAAPAASPPRAPGAPWRRWARVAAAALAVSIAAGAWYRFVLAEPPPLEVRTIVVADGEPGSAPTLTAGGYIRDPRVVYVAPRVTGRISHLAVAEGDQLRAGDLVAVLDRRDFEQDLLEARADLDAADARLRRLQAGSRPEDVAAARARVAAAEAASDRARAEARIQAGTLDALREALAVEEAGSRPEDIAAAFAAVAAARARWQGAVNRLHDTRVIAPVGGRVLRKFRSVGDVVSPDVAYLEGAETVSVGSPIVSLAEVGPQEAAADINETDLARVTIGQPVEVSPNAFPDVVIRGTVSHVSPRADRNKNTVEVKVALAGDARPLPYDLSVKLTFLAGTPARAERRRPSIPADAVVTKDGRSWVFVAEGTRATARAVVPGLLRQGHVEIAAGLVIGERVIVGDLAALADGSRIAIR